MEWYHCTVACSMRSVTIMHLGLSRYCSMYVLLIQPCLDVNNSNMSKWYHEYTSYIALWITWYGLLH